MKILGALLKTISYFLFGKSKPELARIENQRKAIFCSRDSDNIVKNRKLEEAIYKYLVSKGYSLECSSYIIKYLKHYNLLDTSNVEYHLINAKRTFDSVKTHNLSTHSSFSWVEMIQSRRTEERTRSI